MTLILWNNVCMCQKDEHFQKVIEKTATEVQHKFVRYFVLRYGITGHVRMWSSITFAASP